MNCSLPGSSVHGIFQARIPEWDAISHSRGSSQFRGGTHVSWILSKQILYRPSHLGSPEASMSSFFFFIFFIQSPKLSAFIALILQIQFPGITPHPSTHTDTQTHGGRAFDCTHVFVYTNGLQFEVTFSFLGRLGQREDMLVYEERAAFLDSIVKIWLSV